MAIKQTKDGWKVDFRAGGANGKRYRKTCKTKAEAERYQKYVEAQLITTGKPWQSKPKDPRRLSELAQLWKDHIGLQLKDFEARARKLDHIVDGVGDPVASQLSPEIFNGYLSAKLKRGRSKATVNKDIVMLGAVYNGLFKLGIIDYENPVKVVKKLKLDHRELSFLSHIEIVRLLKVLDDMGEGDTRLISEICINTGARWGEAEHISKKMVRHGKLTFTNTKNGKNRSIPVSETLFNKIKAHAAKVKGDFVFDQEPRKLRMDVFAEAIAIAKIELPVGQNTHVLRHTFASHFVINGGNILSLMKILDHSDISITMKYAHLAKDHFIDAITYGPQTAGGGHIVDTDKIVA
ncbi:phage integrase [Marinomonas atlantica]|uniref:phage integrase n=1 Tax=Marinomonas atlantica TaxID=1806668 RepID=UPI00082FB680|nr:tyrosine-type recombinase/integrase [Marinomonas atlantica]